MRTKRTRSRWSEFLPHQARFFLFEPRRSRMSVEALLGGWRSGKTNGVARKCVKVLAQNQQTAAYGGSNPTAIVCAPTYRTLRDATLPALMALLPRSWIKRMPRGAPHNDILLHNGVRILLTSAEAELEGVTAFMVWCDEISKAEYWSGEPAPYLNLLARISDPLSPRMAMLVSGRPEVGAVQDQFRFDADAPNAEDRITILASMADNPHIPKETRDHFLSSCASGEEEALIRGEWMTPSGSVYPQLADENFVARDGDRARYVDLGIDIGDHGCVVVAQTFELEVVTPTGKKRETALLVIDEINTLNEGLAAQLNAVKARGWQISKDSMICIDPTSRREEIQAIREAFGSSPSIIKHEKSSEFYKVEPGIRVVQRALRDVFGNRRLVFARTMVARSPKGGLLESMRKYRRNRHTGEAIRDNEVDHPCDALRYVVVKRLAQNAVQKTMR